MSSQHPPTEDPPISAIEVIRTLSGMFVTDEYKAKTLENYINERIAQALATWVEKK